MSGRPFILVPMQLFRLNPKSALKVAAARDTYLKKFERYELTPLFVSPYASDESADEFYEMASGVFFMGGSDIDPAYYRRPRHPLTEVFEPERDRVEQRILKRLLAEKKRPYLGICRGCQSLCVACGGTLIQHIPDLIEPEKSGERHDVEFYHELLTADKHPVQIDPASRLYKIVGTAAGQVNSAHHQAVETVGSGFHIAARSPAGVIEAIERDGDDFFCLGIQSHPEAEEEGLFEKVFAAFAQAVKEFE